MCKSALLFSKKDYNLGDSLRYLCRKERINLMYALTFPEVLHYCLKYHPEILFFDGESINFNLDLYKEFIQTRYFEIPKIILFCTDKNKINFKVSSLVFFLNSFNFIKEYPIIKETKV